MCGAQIVDPAGQRSQPIERAIRRCDRQRPVGRRHGEQIIRLHNGKGPAADHIASWLRMRREMRAEIPVLGRAADTWGAGAFAVNTLILSSRLFLRRLSFGLFYPASLATEPLPERVVNRRCCVRFELPHRVQQCRIEPHRDQCLRNATRHLLFLRRP
jgi:hypothetical protein